jgi:hypothetical protein
MRGLEVKGITEVGEASPAYPVIAVRSRPPLWLGIGIVAEDVIPKVDPAKVAVVVVTVRSV